MKENEATGRIQKNFNVTIPQKIREVFQLDTGDFVQFVVVKDGILLKPKRLIDLSQAYFWTKEWQKDELQAVDDINTKKVSKTKNAKELIKKLKI